MLCSTILEAMGKTPVVKLQRTVPSGYADVFVKLEGFNPGGSHKARIALNMILEAEKEGRLIRDSGQTIIEPTGGNTGIGLAMAAAILGYKVILVIPDSYSPEKQRVLLAYGAEVILTRGEALGSHVEKVHQLLATNPSYVFLDQFSNKANAEVHRKNTAAEILDDMEQVDCFICGIGTGGSITGIGETLKVAFPGLRVIGVEPEGCKILERRFVRHEIQGLAPGVFPPILNVAIIDDMISVSAENAKEAMRRMAKEEGLLLGISSGANIYAAIQEACQLGPGKVVLTMAPDFGNSYLDYFK